LCQGWNLISWPSITTVPVADGLGQIDGKYDIIWAYDAADSADPWKKYNPEAIFGNDLTSLEPGFGYWVRMTEPGTLTVANR
jgi:carbohydrate-selective porin OprB